MAKTPITVAALAAAAFSASATAQSDRTYLTCSPQPFVSTSSRFEYVYIISQDEQSFRNFAIGGAAGEQHVCGIFADRCDVVFSPSTITVSMDMNMTNFIWTHDLATNTGWYQDRRRNEGYDYQCQEIDPASVEGLVRDFEAEREQARQDRPFVMNFNPSVAPAWGPSTRVDHVVLQSSWVEVSADEGFNDALVAAGQAACREEDYAVELFTAPDAVVFANPAGAYRLYDIQASAVPEAGARMLRLHANAFRPHTSPDWRERSEPGPTHQFIVATFNYADGRPGAVMQSVAMQDRLAGDAYFRCGDLGADIQQLQQAARQRQPGE